MGSKSMSPAADKLLAGLPQLLDDLQKLSDDHDTADVVFLLKDEERAYAHRIILMARCKSFQVIAGMSAGIKRNEICRIPGSTVLPSTGTPTPTLIRLPLVPADIFRQFLLYIYTAKLMLQDSRVFEMMNLAQDFGVSELKAACEDHVISTMSYTNACTFLLNAMEIQEKVGKNAISFVERCISFIGENANECTKTSSFLNLSKEAVVKIISSDYLCLDEEDVWRSVLNWAKNKAGVTQPTAHWSEEERARVCQHLSPIIGHVRILLIDSQVFAEEVEPTKLLPIEISLERYRFAALQTNKVPGGAVPDVDKRLQPRLSINLFPGSNILKNDKIQFHTLNTLNGWIGTNSKQSWRLVYRASLHGFSASAFHRHCDGIAPLIVVALGNRGEISGGYTDQAFSKSSRKGGYLHSERAFLYTLSSNPPTKFDIIKKSYAICYHVECGPIFGAGADLMISNNCNSNIDSYSNLPHSYDGVNASCTTLFSDYNFSIQDYEVFTVANNGGNGQQKSKHERFQ